MKGFNQDIRFVCRVMIKNPGFTLVAAITLALGIGVNTTIFSIVNAYLFRPLPVQNPSELMAVATTSPAIEVPYVVSYADYKDVQEHSQVFSDAIGFANAPTSLSFADKSERVWLDGVTGNYFSVLGVPAFAGRTFTREEGQVPGSSPVLVLTYKFWQSRFGGDYSVIGRGIKLDGKPFTIIGITPKSFTGTDSIIECDGYVPFGSILDVFGGQQALTDRTFTCLNVLARLKPGVGKAEAQQSLKVLSALLTQDYPKTNTGVTFVTVPERESRPVIGIARTFGQAAMVFSCFVAMIMLIACMNVISLMLARASARQKELAIRGALGASRNRLIRLFVIEGMFLALLGGAAGLGIGLWASGLMSGIKLPGIAVTFDLNVDWRVFAFTFAVVAGAGLLSGLLPALGVSRPDLNETLKEGARGNVGGRGWQRLRSGLVVAQVAISFLLLICAGLFLRSMQAAEHANLGFRTTGVLMGSIDLGLQGYDDAKSRDFQKRLLDRLKELPGVKDASLCQLVPFSTSSSITQVITEESELSIEGHREMAFYDSVT
ncbi:MAG TPA: ABC transporter permease, partial [Blastocatellia bacterium]